MNLSFLVYIFLTPNQRRQEQKKRIHSYGHDNGYHRFGTKPFRRRRQSFRVYPLRHFYIHGVDWKA